MKKHDEKEIIVQTGLNIDLLGSLTIAIKRTPNKSVLDFYNDWQKSIGWDRNEPYSIVNQGVLLTHLYGLFVYPQQVFFDDIPKDKYLSQIDKNKWGNFSIITLPPKPIKLPGGNKIVNNENELTLEYFLKKIRNSLSHGSVKIDADLTFTFSDKDGIQIKFGVGGLQTFVEKFRKCCLSEKWD